MEYGRQIEDDNIQLQCHLYGLAPVQGEGTVMGQALYFRAKYKDWTFAVANSEFVDPVDIDFPEQGFLREGQYAKASYMDYDDAEAIIRRCAREYVESEGKY